MNRFAISLVASCLVVSLVSAKDTKPAKKATSRVTGVSKRLQKNPAFAEVVDDPSLPRVLLIGDSISIGYTVPVRDMLKGKANVHRIMTNGGPTTRGVEQLDSWIGKGDWDLIHFNWGLHDLKFMDDGKKQVSLEDYKKNLNELTDRLGKTGAILVWASTTPVPEGNLKPIRHDSDVKAYNAAAAEIMKKKNIATDDLYSFAKPKLEKIQIPVNVHFTPAGSKVLGKQVAGYIQKKLKDAPKKEPATPGT
ncbi:GDSL-like Lipase/Acylhydrolase [Planctomycetes bacterium Pan216]|uniref:GDSL-like Lipase/Acylhydrolase n=1 Tax=Kolteria novifilia TaxID=2527975 RepID=A0A518B921_9BACT|nr:GDSL-like Lipase/Acylhydrolase [Planctomycetes bacterium Pan216]